MSETISQIGEFGLIRRVRDLVRAEGCGGRGIVVGIGDDTASFLPEPDREILITCDAMVEGRHFLPERMSPYDLGRRAMVSNVSDIGAMGGHPLYALISLGLRPEMAVFDLEQLYRGFLFELNPFGASIIGGNITGTGERVFIDITLVGEVDRGRAVRRSTARPGDSILVTGFPGQSAAGLHLLLEGQGREAAEDHPLVRKYLVPGHRASAGRAVAATGLVSAMIDTSDGLIGDLAHICEESGTGALLDEGSLPMSAALVDAAGRLGVDPYRYLLGPSDDYELILTCAAEHVGDVRSAVEKAGVEIVSEVGAITAQGGIRLVGKDGRERGLRPAGWDHFGSV
jgi:thiamine-monophosphate kinase